MFPCDGQDAGFAKVDENWAESLLEVVSNVPDCEDHQSLRQPSSSPLPSFRAPPPGKLHSTKKKSLQSACEERNPSSQRGPPQYRKVPMPFRS